MRPSTVRALALALPFAGSLLPAVPVAAAVDFYVNDEPGWIAAWESVAGASPPSRISFFDTTAPNVALADELVGYPPQNYNVGTTLTFRGANTGLCRDFGIRTAAGVPMTFDDDEGTNLPDFDDALSIGDIDDYENDDFEILISKGPPLYALALTIRDWNSPDAGESLRVEGHDGSVLGTLTGASIPAGNVTIGVVSDVPIRRVFFDEDTTGDDIALAELRFDDPTQNDTDGDGLSDCDEAALFIGDAAAFDAAWEAQVGTSPAVELFPTTSTNVGSADEVGSPPGPNTGVGNTLTFDRANTGLCHRFTLRTVGGEGMTFDDDEGAGNLPNFDDALSIGDIDNAENDDFDVELSPENPTYAFGMEIVDNGLEYYESLTVYDTRGRLIVSASDTSLMNGTAVFLGVVSDDPIGRVRFDEGAGGDDAGVRDFRFGVGTDTDADGVLDCDDPDVDGDQIPNGDETLFGLDASDPSDALVDPDVDGWTSREEVLFLKDPLDGADSPAPLLQPSQKLLASDGGANQVFGASVALDGDLAAIGAPANALSTAPTAVYLFRESGGVWSEEAQLLPPAGAGISFGRAVAVSGGTVLVGAVGGVWAFTESGGVWTDTELVVAGGAGASFGITLDLDGDTAVVGEPDAESAWVFTRSGGVWSAGTAVVPSLPPGFARFGTSVSVSGTTLAVGADVDGGTGAAYVFVDAGSGFAEQARLVGSDTLTGSGFGSGVAVDGDTLLVGSQSWDGGFDPWGAAYVFARNAGVWTEVSKLAQSDGFDATYFLGYRVALAGDLALVGNNLHFVRRSAYLYDRAGGAWPERDRLISPSTDGTIDNFGIEVAVDATTAIVTAKGDTELGSVAGAAYAFPVTDTDGDGLPDAAEAAWGSNPASGDSDGDGLLDLWEARNALDPALGGQGALDPDADGLDNATEQSLGTHPRLPDTDEDQLLDGFELAHGFDPLAPGETNLDPDADGLDNLGEQAHGTPPLVADGDADGANDSAEVASGTDPYVADTDGDGLLDGFEIASGFDPLGTDESGDDPDGDGLDNLGEQGAGTDANVADTDGDTVNDGDEVTGGADPLTYAQDADGDGIPSGAEFAAGLLPGDASDGPLDLDGDGWPNEAEYRFGTAIDGALDTPAGLADPHQKVFAADGRPGERFGTGVAVDGDWAVIGAPFVLSPVCCSGAAYVFERIGGLWVEQARLEGDDFGEFTLAELGASVAIDGDTIALGAPRDAGAVYVFRRSGSVWSQEAKLVASTPTNGLGTSIALDGDTLVAGAPEVWGVGANSGEVYVFARTGSVWTQQAQLVGSQVDNQDRFGASVSVEGDTLAVGAPTAGAGFSAGVGAAYVFTRSGTAWSEEDVLAPSDGATGDDFGRSVAVQGDRLLAGAPADDDGGAGSGSAYHFTRSAGSWSEQGKLAAGAAAAGDAFGSALALSGDALLVGAPGDGDGSAYRFAWNGSAWVETHEVAAADLGVQTGLAAAVALSGDDALAGARLGSGDYGAGYFFRFGDLDGDGLSDAQEGVWGTDPAIPDTDADGADDFVEVGAGTDPLLVDSDGDGFGDGHELGAGSDPLDPLSTPAVPQVPIPPWAHLVVMAGLLGLGRAARR